jgi:hypothetical protein
MKIFLQRNENIKIVGYKFNKDYFDINTNEYYLELGFSFLHINGLRISNGYEFPVILWTHNKLFYRILK